MHASFIQIILFDCQFLGIAVQKQALNLEYEGTLFSSVDVDDVDNDMQLYKYWVVWCNHERRDTIRCCCCWCMLGRDVYQKRTN